MVRPSHLPSRTRRDFLKASSAAVSAPFFIRASALGLGGYVSASDRIVMGAIGCGGKGRHNSQQFLADPRVQMAATCDVDAKHLQTATDEINAHYSNSDCGQYRDFRELIARGDLDAVHVSTPDHWHATIAVRAMLAGLDVYCEKPLANSFGESKAIRDTAQRTGRIVQCGSQERSNPRCRLAAELALSGRLGKVHTVEIHMPCDEPHHQQARAAGTPAEQPVPENLDWDLWLGPAAAVPYAVERCHFWWRFVLACGGGEMTDRGAHIIDLAQLALGQDDCGPVELVARGQTMPESVYDAFWDFQFENRYANGARLIGSSDGPRGLKLVGDEGWLFVAIHGGELTASRPEILPETMRSDPQHGADLPSDELSIQLGRSPGHHTNFLDCVINRQTPIASAAVAHRTATICHLNNIAMRTGRPLRWDPLREEVINDPHAGSWLIPDMRQPWTV